MSRTFVHAGRRRTFTPTVINAAGDLVYQNGFFGVVQDTTRVGVPAMMVLEGVHELKNVYGSNLNPGVKVSAAPSVVATTETIWPAPSVAAGGVAFGRVWATSPASSATATVKVQLFNPNQY
jgi:predicted RecA/RadA family phage recombinase